MKRTFGILLFASCGLPIITTLLIETSCQAGDDGALAAGKSSSRAWTLEEAMARLRLEPHDPYLQYVALQLSRRQRQEGATADEIARLSGGWQTRMMADRRRVDLFEIFTGALAVQESLQLDTMRGEGPGRMAWPTRPPIVPAPVLRYEAETLQIINKASSCRTSRQRMTSWGENRWSRGAQLFCDCDKDGFVELKLPAPTGRYRITLLATRAPDYGKIRVGPNGSVIDAYSPRVEPSGPIDLGVTTFVAGQASLRFEVMDKNDASAGYRFGIDRIDLMRQETLPEHPGSAPNLASPPSGGEAKPERLPVATLAGPAIKSHPWTQLLAGQTPQISRLAKSVPADYYFIEFQSVNKLLEAAETTDLWGAHLLNQASQEARKSPIVERLKKQLAIETDPLLRPLYDQVVQAVAITGSDPFVREGSDVTVLLQFRLPELLKPRLDGFLANAEKTRPDAVRTIGNYLGMDYVHVATPDRHINVFSAYPAADLHVRSNSLTALQRVLEAINGKTSTGEPVSRLGDSAEFAYIRTLLPAGVKEEDGLIYLSDPFIRHLVGPELKLTERHRLLCYNHLRMIGHSALLYQTEHGKPPDSLEELASSGCTPGAFNEGKLRCPDGGTYRLSEDGSTGICTHHGASGLLRPCCEVPVTTVSGDEAREYQAFVQTYNQYWRTYFDPIALRIQISPERYRLETIVLPLIDNSIYTGLATALGGKPEPLDALPVPHRNIFSVNVRFNKEELLSKMRPYLREAGLDVPETVIKESPRTAEPVRWEALDSQCALNLHRIALAMHNYHDAYGRLPEPKKLDKDGKPLLSWRVLLLPFLGEAALYREFNLNEPWDSEHNKELIARMPQVYRCPRQNLADKGKTTYAVPIGPRGKDATLFTYGNASLARVPDGTSNTIMLLDVADDRAVTWTKPDDFDYNPEQPAAGLAGRHPQAFPLALADGSLHFLKNSIDKDKLRALFSSNGREMVALEPSDQIPAPRFAATGGPDLRRRSALIPGLNIEDLRTLKIYDFLSRGIGSQVGLHVYDAEPNFDFNLAQFLGEMVGWANRPFGPGTELVGLSFLIASLNAPVYISIPIENDRIVDEFLDALNDVLTTQVSNRTPGFFRLTVDFYQCRGAQNKEIPFRTCSIGFGPIKWRLFWARIGNGLYVASQPFILEDLAGGRTTTPSPTPNRDFGPVAHAMVRIRPENWQRVLSAFQLGWAENNREACINNLGSLSNVARALTVGVENMDERDSAAQAERCRHRADELYDRHAFCPDGGEYVLAPDGRGMVCTRHGSLAKPRQELAPIGTSALGKLLKDFRGMTASLVFLDDGLHATVEIDRK
jgi:hypothetical protein